MLLFTKINLCDDNGWLSREIRKRYGLKPITRQNNIK